MATDFDVTTYPLETNTKFKPSLGTKLDKISGGGRRLRVLTTTKPMQITCVFNPQSATASNAFLTYMRDNAATQFNITHNSRTYRGYIDGDSLDCGISDGVLHWWSFVFESDEV